MQKNIFFLLLDASPHDARDTQSRNPSKPGRCEDESAGCAGLLMRGHLSWRGMGIIRVTLIITGLESSNLVLTLTWCAGWVSFASL